MFDGAITPAGVRDDLVACCEDAAEWRRYRAAEFSQGGRNLAAAQALEVAAESIASLRVNDRRLRHLASLWRSLGEEERVFVFAEQRRIVLRYGYLRTGTPGTLVAEIARTAEATLGGRQPLDQRGWAGGPFHRDRLSDSA